MSRSASLLPFAGLVLLLVTATSCGGELIHLGDDGKAQGDGGAKDARTDGLKDTNSDGGIDQGTSCAPSQVKASEVLWIGDGWVTTPQGIAHTTVRDLAREKGIIGPDDDYVVAARSGATMAAVVSQYNTSVQQAGTTQFKILIMDGGTYELFLASNVDTTIKNAVTAFGQLLDTVEADGTIEHIIYFLSSPMPTFPGIAALGPLMQEKCAASKVDCHFLDLQPLWAANAEYMAADGSPLPSAAGAQAIGDEIWKIMQDNCIAQ